MHEIKARGAEVRATAKRLVFGLHALERTLSERAGGFNAIGDFAGVRHRVGVITRRRRPSRQQYWVVAILRELEKL
jgi:hypothetical protein